MFGTSISRVCLPRPKNRDRNDVRCAPFPSIHGFAGPDPKIGIAMRFAALRSLAMMVAALRGKTLHLKKSQID